MEAQILVGNSFGRLGGDEFAVVLPSADRLSVENQVRELIASFNEPFVLNETNFMIGASIGAAFYPEHGPDTATLLRCADIAMYEAKRGRLDYLPYSTEMGGQSTDALALTSELRQCLAAGALELHYQPKLDLGKQRIVGYEALARWPHPERGMILPDLFIPMMEHTGLIRKFTEWVLNTALAQCREWKTRGEHAEIAINLSMHNLRDPSFPSHVLTAMERWKIEPTSIVFEITESVFMGDKDVVLRTLEQLSRHGIRFSIDDFGTGYSSLSLLKQLPVSEIKVDRSFVQQMLDRKDDATIVRSTIDMAINLGLHVVAEGVENEQTIEALANMGCHLVQGYHIGKPRPASELGPASNPAYH